MTLSRRVRGRSAASARAAATPVRACCLPAPTLAAAKATQSVGEAATGREWVPSEQAGQPAEQQLGPFRLAVSIIRVASNAETSRKRLDRATVLPHGTEGYGSDHRHHELAPATWGVARKQAAR
jgi:hypothetical protein